MAENILVIVQNDLNKNSKNVNAIFRVIEIGSPKMIKSKFGVKRVQEVKVADTTGCILLSLWDDQIVKIAGGDTLRIWNGSISVVKNSMRLNIGKYGKLYLEEKALPEVNVVNNLSALHVEKPEEKQQREKNRKNEEERYQAQDRFLEKCIEKATSLKITRTIYDPESKDFVFDSGEKKALPAIMDWINNRNPVIYWYILRIDNLTDTEITQWAVELYTHQALSITEAYIDGIDRRFELKKRERDAWIDKYVLSVPRQLGIPVVSKGTRRLYFKIDINCKEGLMHEYGISGAFMAQGMKDVEIKEKMFQYSCKEGEFKQIFDHDPNEAAVYAEHRLKGRYSPQSVRIFTNSFRMIYELSRYCHSGSAKQDELLSRLYVIHTSFVKVPDIAGERIIPLIQNKIGELNAINDRATLAPDIIRLCDSLVELLHIEVMGAEPKTEIDYKTQTEPSKVKHQIKNKDTIKREQSAPNAQDFEIAIRHIFKEAEIRGDTFIDVKAGDLHRQVGGYPGPNNRMPICCSVMRRLMGNNDVTLSEPPSGLGASLQIRYYLTIHPIEERTSAPIISPENELLRIQRKRDVEKEHKKKEAIPETDTNSIGMKFTLIPKGEFMMGSEECDNEKPVHKVTISKPFYLGIYPVTQKEWKTVMGDNPSYFKGDNLPVENVSWDDIQKFIKKLNEKEGANKYRLPSEAEWEYAARAGTTTRYSFGDDESELKDYAWYAENSGYRPPRKGDYFGYEYYDRISNKWNGKTHPVGEKKPNAWRLYDMYGNVWEYVHDKWHRDYNGAPTDGSAWETGDSPFHVVRGGGWGDEATSCRSARRWHNINECSLLGFRLLRSL